MSDEAILQILCTPVVKAEPTPVTAPMSGFEKVLAAIMLPLFALGAFGFLVFLVEVAAHLFARANY